MITQTSEENSEKEMIDLCDESHVMLSDVRLYNGEKEQKTVTIRQVKVSQVRHIKTGPEKASRAMKIKELNQQ